MEKKYSLTNESKIVDGHTVYRIIAEKNFSHVKKGTLGGFVESENNLSHEGVCWIYGNASICGDARVYENATVYDNAQVRDHALIYGNATVCDDVVIAWNAEVSGNALIYGNARVFDNAKIFGYARVSDNTTVHDNARIYDCAQVCDNAKIFGCARIYNYAEVFDDAEVFGDAKIFGYADVYGCAIVYNEAQVYDDAQICGNATVCGNAMVYGCAIVDGVSQLYDNAVVNQEMTIKNAFVSCALSDNLVESIRCQTGLGVFDNKVIAYKQINKDMTSFHDRHFKYEVGKIIEIEDAEISNKSCASGLHFSNMNYWNKEVGENTGYLMAEIDIKDVITVQQGKIRCKRAKILGVYIYEKNNRTKENQQ